MLSFLRMLFKASRRVSVGAAICSLAVVLASLAGLAGADTPHNRPAPIPPELPTAAQLHQDPVQQSSEATRDRTKDAFDDISASDALLLAEHTFGVSDAGANPPAAPGTLVRRLDAFSEVRQEAGHDVVVVSSIPMAVRDDDGTLKKPSIDLEHDADGWSPERPVVPIAIDQDTAATKIDSDVDIAPQTDGGDDPAPQRIGNTIFFAGADHATDYLVNPTATGAELSWQLRSAESPESLKLDVTVPQGAHLQPEFGAGSPIEVIGDDKGVLASIMPPIAVDADGVPVPTTMHVTDDGVAVDVPHRDKGFRYPILVDPLVNYSQYSGNYGNGSFPNWFNNANTGTYWYGSNPSGGVYTTSGGSGKFGYWYVAAPGSAQIFRADLSNVQFNNYGYQSAWMYANITGSGSASAISMNGYVANSSLGTLPYYDSSTFSQRGYVLCAAHDANTADGSGPNGFCRGYGGNSGNQLQMGMYTGAPFSANMWSSWAMTGAAITMGDSGLPTQPTTRSTWYSDRNSVTLSASQGGLGVSGYKIYDASGNTQKGAVDFGCASSQSLPPCQQNPGYTTVSLSSSLPDGANTLQATATTLTGAENRGSITARVDTANPIVTLNGPRTINGPTQMSLQASDPNAGVQIIAANVTRPDQSAYTAVPATYCPQPYTAGCSVPATPFTLTPTQRGTYKIDIYAYDNASPANGGLVQTINVRYVNPPSAPTGVGATPGPGPGAITANWTASSDNGGSALAGYTIRARNTSTNAVSTKDVSAASTTGTITGLPWGQYAITIRATNSDSLSSGDSAEAGPIQTIDNDDPVIAATAVVDQNGQLLDTERDSFTGSFYYVGAYSLDATSGPTSPKLYVDNTLQTETYYDAPYVDGYLKYWYVHPGAFADGQHDLRIEQSDRAGHTVIQHISVVFDTRGDIYKATSYGFDPGHTNPHALDTEWAQVKSTSDGTNNIRVEDDDLISTRTTLTRADGSQYDEDRWLSDSTREGASGAPGSSPADPDGESYVTQSGRTTTDVDLPVPGSLLTPRLDPPAGSATSGAIADVLRADQHAPPGHNDQSRRYETNITWGDEDGDDDSTTAPAVQRLWVDDKTSLPLKETVTLNSGAVVESTYFDYDRNRLQQDDEVPATFFAPGAPSNEATEQRVASNRNQPLTSVLDPDTGGTFAPQFLGTNLSLSTGGWVFAGSDTVSEREGAQFAADDDDSYLAPEDRAYPGHERPETFVMAYYQPTNDPAAPYSVQASAHSAPLTVTTWDKDSSSAQAWLQTYQQQGQAIEADPSDPDHLISGVVSILSPVATNAYVIGLANNVTSAVFTYGNQLVLIQGPFPKSAVSQIASSLGVL